MLEDRREDSGPDPGEECPDRLNPSKLDAPSGFVGDVVEYLTSIKDREFSPSKEQDYEAGSWLLGEMRRQGVGTPREFALFVSSVDSLCVNDLLSRVFEDLYDWCSMDHVVQSLPPLVSLAHNILMRAESPNNSVLREVIERVLETWREDELGLLSSVGDVVGDRERELLLSVVSGAKVERDGYLQSINMLCELFPDARSHAAFVQALGRLNYCPDGSSNEVREVVLRCASAFAKADFQGAFDFLGRNLCDLKQPVMAPSVNLVAEGFRDTAALRLAFLEHKISSGEPELRIFALKVLIFAGLEREDDDLLNHYSFDSAQRQALAELIRTNFLSEGNDSAEISRKLALAALASISSRPEDVELARNEMRAILERWEIPSPELCESVVNGSQRVHRVKARSPFAQLDVPCEERLFLMVRNENVVTLEPSAPIDLEQLALSIGRAGSAEEVLEALLMSPLSVNSSEAVPRPTEALELFDNPDHALSFLSWYRELIEQGLHRFAVELFPELLSAVACCGFSQDADNLHIRRPMRALSPILVDRPEFSLLASSRLNVRDIRFLTGFASEYDCSRSTAAGVDLILATYELRAALGIQEMRGIPEKELKWPRELVKLWGELPPSVTSQIHPDALARISVISERRTEGSALELLKLVPLHGTFDRELFSAFAYGLTVRSAAVGRTILALVNSESGYDLARGFFLSQLLPCYLEESQGNHVLKMARNSLSEPGALSLDAMCTIGALSSSPTDVGMLLKSQPSIGVDRRLHDATAVAAATQILSVVRHTNGGY